MGITDESRALSNARTPERSAQIAVGGIVTMVIGQILVQAGIHARLGATRSGNYFGPASLLGTGSDGHRPFIVGAIISLVGIAVVLVEAYRLASRIDVSANLARVSASRMPAPSAVPVAGGLAILVIGWAIYEAGRLAMMLRPTAFLGIADLLRNNVTGLEILGAIVAAIGLWLLLLGTYRLLINVQLVANASLESSVARAL